MAQHNKLGAEGEKMAVELLRAKGYLIREQNFRFQRAEIDIIAETADQLVIVEVKTRNSDFFGDPQSFVTPSKIQNLVRAADHYVAQNEINKEVRFDIVAVLMNQYQQRIQHFEDAFYFF